jgi:hypothetical protein
VFLTADLLTPRLTEIAPFLWSCPLHVTEDTTVTPFVASQVSTWVGCQELRPTQCFQKI